MVLRAFSNRKVRQDLDLSVAAEAKSIASVAADAKTSALGAPRGALRAAVGPFDETAGATAGPPSAEPEVRQSEMTEEPQGNDAAGSVVLAIGRPYFHDGTVGQGKYESDLPPTLLGAVESLHILARAVFTEVGTAPEAGVRVAVDGWELLLGPELGHAQLVRHDGLARSPAAPERRAHQWLRGIAALRQSDHGQALAAFQAEAEQAATDGLPQRAAVAYRAAAASARAVGRADQSNRMLRLAGKYYLAIAEGADTLPQGVFSAYREAARAFLEAGNLPLAQQSLTKALAVGEALGLVERS